jgi:aryl-alcohol dehydrogenase-like predicted oxidoreductase
MKRRPLGKTGLSVSELSLGTWGLSGDAYGAVSHEVAEAVVRRALDMGFSLFETADAYGGGQMELLLGKVLPKEAMVVTKVGTDRSTDPPRKRFDGEWLRTAVRRSHKRLGRAVIDVVLLHNPSVEALETGEATDAMKDLVREGVVRHWGVSAGDDLVARAAIDKEAEVLELAYNLVHSIDLHRLAGDIMVSGVGVLARSTLAHGLLSGYWSKERTFEDGDHRNERWTRLELERRVEQLEALRFLVKGDVLTLRGAAVRFVLANPLVSCAVLGPRSVEQLEQLVRETGAGPRYIPDEQLIKLPRVLSKAGILT